MLPSPVDLIVSAARRSAPFFAIAACARLSDGAVGPAADRTVQRAGHSAPALVTPVKPASAAPGVIVTIGGGSEGNIGNQAAWSFALYKEIVVNGDVTGDGVVTIAILSPYTETQFIPNYFAWIGNTLGRAVAASNVKVATLADANSSAVNTRVVNADAVWIKGGDQGVFYDLWNGTQLESSIRAVAGRGGAIGGTSAGAMSLAEYCLCGGKSLESKHVMQDARTPFLDDRSIPGTSGIHDDFLGIVRGVFIDSHVTERSRLGRLLGVIARATEDAALDTISGVGIDSYTGLVIRQGIAEVRGVGSVAFVEQKQGTVRRRSAGHPLVYSNLRLDRLTDGWRYDLGRRRPITTPPPAGVLPVVYPGPSPANQGALTIDGGNEADRSKFELVAAYRPAAYVLTHTTAASYIKVSVGMPHMGNYANRDTKDETLFRALYDQVGAVGFFMFTGGSASRTAAQPDLLSLNGTSGAMIVDLRTATYRGLSPWKSSWSDPTGSLHAAALVGATLHVIGESTANAMRYDTRNHAIIP